MNLETIKWALIAGLTLAVTLGVYQYFTVWGDAQEKLAEAERQKEQLVESRHQLNMKVAALELKETTLEAQIESQQKDIEDRETKIAELQLEFETRTFYTLKTVSEQAIAEEFKKAFELDDAAIQVHQFPVVDPLNGKPLKTPQGNTVMEPLLAVPVDYIKLSVIEKSKAATCAEQLTLQEQITGLERQNVELTREIADLRQEQAREFAKAYEEAYKSFQTIHQNYVALLNAPPKVDLAPRWVQLLGGFVGGLVICSI